MIEATRTLLVLVAAWALLIARRPGLARPPAAGAVAVSGAAGHAAAITPILSIPLKSIHLIAVSIWFGGVLWLVLSATLHTDFPGTCRRVSKAALLSVVAIAITGVVQALLIAPVRELIVSPYGLVLGIKTVLFLILIAIGWYNRFRIMPEIDSEASHERMRRSATRESTLMLLVLLVAGLLAYVPTPQP